MGGIFVGKRMGNERRFRRRFVWVEKDPPFFCWAKPDVVEEVLGKVSNSGFDEVHDSKEEMDIKSKTVDLLKVKSIVKGIPPPSSEPEKSQEEKDQKQTQNPLFHSTHHTSSELERLAFTIIMMENKDNDHELKRRVEVRCEEEEERDEWVDILKELIGESK